MPHLRRFLILAAAIAAGSFTTGVWYGRRADPPRVTAGASRQILHYTCPMHPSYISDRPGTAPCCGMRLEPVYADGTIGTESGGESLPPGTVQVGPEKQQIIGIRTATVGKTSNTRSIRTLGRVEPDERLVYRIKAVIDGWIRQTSSNSTGSIVRKNERLASLYSLDFQNGVTAYLYALASIDQAKKAPSGMSNQMEILDNSLRMAAETLENLGMSSLQMEELRRTRQPTKDIVLYSPAAGLVLARNISEGQRVIKGDELYRIADLSSIWILADLYDSEARFIRPGLTGKVTCQGRVASARVSDVLPEFDLASRTLKVRLEAVNPGYRLRPDMLVDVELQIKLPPAVTVPVDAVVDSGLRKTVYVDRGNGYFEPRTVETGWRFGDAVEIASGLDEGERIVVAGNFMLDSESRMRLAAAQANKPEPKKPAATVHKDPVCGMDVEPDRSAPKSEYRGKTYYFCSGHCKREFDKAPAKFADKKA